MTQEYILNELKTILKRINPKINSDEVNMETRLTEDLGLDSLTILLMSFAIEKRFEFRFSGTPRFTSVGEVVGHIEIMTA